MWSCKDRKKMTASEEKKVHLTGRMDICRLGFNFLPVSDYKLFLKPYRITIINIASSSLLKNTSPFAVLQVSVLQVQCCRSFLTQII